MSTAVALLQSHSAHAATTARQRRGASATKPARNAELSKELQDIMVRDAAKMAALKQKKAEAMKAAGIEAKKRKKNRRNKDSAMVAINLADASNKKTKSRQAREQLLMHQSPRIPRPKRARSRHESEWSVKVVTRPQ